MACVTPKTFSSDIGLYVELVENYGPAKSGQPYKVVGIGRDFYKIKCRGQILNVPASLKTGRPFEFDPTAKIVDDTLISSDDEFEYDKIVEAEYGTP